RMHQPDNAGLVGWVLKLLSLRQYSRREQRRQYGSSELSHAHMLRMLLKTSTEILDNSVFRRHFDVLNNDVFDRNLPTCQDKPQLLFENLRQRRNERHRRVSYNPTQWQRSDPSFVISNVPKSMLSLRSWLVLVSLLLSP